MAREDLRLAIKRRVIAIFGDQHLRQQRRRRRAGSDWPFRRRRLDDRRAGAASVFRARDPHDAKLRFRRYFGGAPEPSVLGYM